MAYAKIYFLVNHTQWIYWRYIIPKHEIKVLPFIIIDKLRPGLNKIKWQAANTILICQIT